MKYQKGDRVKYPAVPEWGLGEVLEDSHGDYVRVFFVEKGVTELPLKRVQLTKVTGEAAKHPVLDNLHISKSQKSKYQTLAQSIEVFLGIFPQGFDDPKYLKQERNYKVEAHHLAQSILNEALFADLLTNLNYDEICKSAIQIANKTNLIFKNEKMALKDGLKDQKNKKYFSEKLFEMLHGKTDLSERFMGFAKVLQNIDAGKWTTASYYLFIMSPDRYVFIKPTVTKDAADVSGFEINYRPELNWLTYEIGL